LIDVRKQVLPKSSAYRDLVSDGKNKYQSINQSINWICKVSLTELDSSAGQKYGNEIQ